MKIAALISRLLLGLVFGVFGLNIFLQFLPMPPIPADTPAGHFFAAVGPTGYIKVVGVFQVLGGLLMLAGRYINLGLTLLGPVIVNIVLFHLLVAGGGLIPVPLVVVILFIIVLASRSDYLATVFRA